MNMPGFTAEASLRENAAPYRMAGTHDLHAGYGTVVPQWQWCERVCEGGGCHWRCWGELER